MLVDAGSGGASNKDPSKTERAVAEIKNGCIFTLLLRIKYQGHWKVVDIGAAIIVDLINRPMEVIPGPSQGWVWTLKLLVKSRVK